MSNIFSNPSFRRGQLVLAFSSLLLLLSGCGSESSDAGQPSATTLRVNTPAQLAQKSADNYDDNTSGLITGQTLKRWISDWKANRPAGITGKLVILQQAKGDAGFEYIKPDNENVFTYLYSNWRETRSNGVTQMGHFIISGAGIDAALKSLGIDVKHDLIVCAQGKAASGNFFNQGRCWYTLRYWGVDAKNLAVLDGDNSHLTGSWTAADFTNIDYNGAVAGPSPLINRQISSVKDLLVDNTVLQATVEDLINVLPLSDRNELNDGVFLWDARDESQFSAGEITGGFSYSSFQNSGSRQGHPRGALLLGWNNLINTSTGHFKSKADLKAYVNGEEVDGKRFIQGADDSYNPVGDGNGYQPGDTVYMWCETSARAAVSFVVSAVILGLPTRMYDGAMLEWNSLTVIKDKNGVDILPSDSPWRTDVLSAPYFTGDPALASGPGSIAPRNAWSDPDDPDANGAPAASRIVNPYAAHADALIKADQAYKAPPVTSGSTGSTGGSGGVSLPGNPCGG